MTEKVLKDLNRSGKMFLIPTIIQDKFIMRFTVTSQFTTREDILRDWTLIQNAAVQVFNLQHRASLGISNPIPMSIGVHSHFFPEKEHQMFSTRIKEQPRRTSLHFAGWLPSAQGHIREDSQLNDCFTEDGPQSPNHKLSSSLSQSAQNKKKTVRSLSVPAAGIWDLNHPKAVGLECTAKSHPCTPDKFLSKLPGEVFMLQKSAFKKLLKFGSVPSSFPECTIQCGLQLPCCPLQAAV